ncbi:MAG: hypothetical protein H8E31_03515 [Planctomycetes bacterium]|nr:hypothetical protein [Planctomycetota bacterium]
MDRSQHIRIAPATTPTLVKEWLLTKRVFQAFLTLPAEERFQHLGKLFERLAPWIERGIRVAVIRHFLVLPQEMLLARIFAKAAKREALHDSHQAFGLWIESQILRDLADPVDQLGVVNGASGEPTAELQRRFNGLPMADRALLYLYLVEKRSQPQVARATGIPRPEIDATLQSAWRQLTRGLDELKLPRGWRKPDFFSRTPGTEGVSAAEEGA